MRRTLRLEDMRILSMVSKRILLLLVALILVVDKEYNTNNRYLAL